MSKFKKDQAKEIPAISTASLPDIVFMLLFFFMATTQLRQTTLKVHISTPRATEISKLEKKTLVSYIYVGPPIKAMQAVYGIEPRIQLNDQYQKVTDIPDFIEAERQTHDESEIPQMITSLKVDENTKMGIVTDIKQELRKAAALHISYSSRKPVKQ
jgi:biopolymer transport protein ExbD